MKWLVGIACRQEQADYCECPAPWPSMTDYGEKCEPVPRSRRVDRIDALTGEAAFHRGIKCFGGRDFCPMCFWKEWALEHPDLMSTGMVPPDSVFHPVRAIHLAGRYIDSGLCEENCPMDIPLRVLYKKGNALVKERFDYETGWFETGLSPWKYLGEEVTLETKPI